MVTIDEALNLANEVDISEWYKRIVNGEQTKIRFEEENTIIMIPFYYEKCGVQLVKLVNLIRKGLYFPNEKEIKLLYDTNLLDNVKSLCQCRCCALSILKGFGIDKYNKEKGYKEYLCLNCSQGLKLVFGEEDCKLILRE